MTNCRGSHDETEPTVVSRQGEAEAAKHEVGRVPYKSGSIGGVLFTIALKCVGTCTGWTIALYLFAPPNDVSAPVGDGAAYAPGHGHSRRVLGIPVDDDLISQLKKYGTLVLAAAVLVALVYDYMAVPRAYPQEIVNGPMISGGNPEIPLQDDLSAGRSFRDGNFTIEVLAGYDIYGIVVHHESYRYDALSSISSLDIGIAFGDFVRQPDLLNRFQFSQFDRFIYIKPKGSMPGDDWTQYAWQVSNNHLIFSNGGLARIVQAASIGDRVRLKGYLIKASTANLVFTSSLTRHDTGPGACEIIFVTDARVFR